MGTTSTTSSTASVFIGRQPIFDGSQNVHAYELLFRSSQERNAFDQSNADEATRRVIDNSLHVMSLDELVGRKRAFINMPRHLLLDQTYTVLPAERVVVELLETVEPDAEVVAAVKQLKDAGYTLALDDFVFDPRYRPLLEYADILKVDWLLNSDEQRQKYARDFRRSILLAEKVETPDDYRKARDMGYTYFQGYFFCKPQIVRGRALPAMKANQVLFLREINQPQLDFDRIESVVKRDLALSMRLLRYLNSSAVGMRHRVTSIRQSLALMGEEPLRKWASVAAMNLVGDDKPAELMTMCLARARFCEQIGPSVGLAHRELDLFLLGLFSGIDALMDQPMAEALVAIPLPPEVAAALLGADGQLSQVYRLCLALERGQTVVAQILGRGLQTNIDTAGACWRQALAWTDANMPK